MRLLSMEQHLDVLHTDRLQLLDNNKKVLCQKIDIETDLLDILTKQGVLTTKDKQQIVVGISYLAVPVTLFCTKCVIICYNHYNHVYTIVL